MMRIEHCPQPYADAQPAGQRRQAPEAAEEAPRRETLAKGEITTYDKSGNKVTEKLGGEENNSLCLRCGNVMLEVTDEALREKILAQIRHRREFGPTEEERRRLDERNAEFEKTIKSPMAYLRAIPNMQTHNKFVESLEGVDEKVKSTAYHIVFDEMLAYDIGGMTEEQRQDRISLSLEKARYLAEHYLSPDKAGKYMEAMETVAKYGMNGKTEDGKVTYDIRLGHGKGVPDDYVDLSDMMKKLDPEFARKECAVFEEAIKNNDSAMLTEWALMVDEWHMNLERTAPWKISAIGEEFVAWKRKMENTPLKDTYKQSDTSDMQSFMDSILRQNGSLSRDYLVKDLNEFADSLR